MPIYDLNAQFINRHISRYSRAYDQMDQAGRSGTQNISESSTQQSLSGYIRLVGVARGSLEELLKDYQAYARHHNITIWPADKCKKEDILRKLDL